MSAFAPITPDVHAIDSAITNRTYNPSTIDPAGVAKLFQTGTSIDARAGLSLSVRQPKAGGSVARVTAKVVIPVMAGTTPDVKTGESLATCEFVVPKSMTALQRRELYLTVIEFLKDGAVQSAVDDLEAIY